MNFARASVLVLAAFLAASTSWGQNLLSNPDFDVDVLGWLPFADVTIEWDSLDVDADPGSGSGLVTNQHPSAGDASGARRCVDGITAGSQYQVVANLQIPGAQSETGKANVMIQWYEQAGCTSGFITFDSTPWVTDSTSDVWVSQSLIFESPSAAQSARFFLQVFKNEADGSFQVHYDHLLFEELIFGNGFETGDTLQWSATVGE